MTTLDAVKQLIDKTLGLGGRAERFSAETPLLGALPELDSMAVVTLLTAIEERFGIQIEDDEVEASLFETLGSLACFIDAKGG